MAKKISELTSASALDGTETLAVVQGGTTVQTTVENIRVVQKADLAQNTVHSFTPPSKGGFVKILPNNANYPQHPSSAIIVFDCGLSLSSELVWGGSQFILQPNNTSLTGTTGPIDRVSVSIRDNEILVESRISGTYTFVLDYSCTL